MTQKMKPHILDKILEEMLFSDSAFAKAYREHVERRDKYLPMIIPQ